LSGCQGQDSRKAAGQVEQGDQIGYVLTHEKSFQK